MATCCDNPQPRVLESSGRLFCGSCRRYLDSATVTPQPTSQAPPRVGAPHLERCVGASLATLGEHSDGYDCACPCHADLPVAAISS
jgi:hypothetical protein